jgi:hypothetical protein
VSRFKISAAHGLRYFTCLDHEHGENALEVGEFLSQVFHDSQRLNWGHSTSEKDQNHGEEASESDE